MMKSCSRCGKLHPHGYICIKGKQFKGGDERKLRHSNAWTQKSLEIRERANGLCEVCRDKGRYVYQDIEVHHIIKLRDNPNGLLDDDNLIALCHNCHKMADNGELKIDYLRSLVALREERDSPPPL